MIQTNAQCVAQPPGLVRGEFFLKNECRTVRFHRGQSHHLGAFQLSRDAFILQSDKISINYLRPFMTKDLAATGDAEKKEIIVEYTLEMRAPKAHGAVYDLL